MMYWGSSCVCSTVYSSSDRNHRRFWHKCSQTLLTVHSGLKTSSGRQQASLLPMSCLSFQGWLAMFFLASCHSQTSAIGFRTLTFSSLYTTISKAELRFRISTTVGSKLAFISELATNKESGCQTSAMAP